MDEIAAPEVKSEHDLLAALYPQELVNFVSLPQHLATICVFDLILLAIMKFTKGWRDTSLSPENRKPRPITTIENIIEKTFALVLFVSLILQTYYKSLIHTKYTAHMLAPCHAVSTLYIYILLHPNHEKATQSWNVGVFYSFYPMLALISMDGSDFIFPGMCEVSYAQHIVLAILPFYLLLSNRLPIEKSQVRFFKRSIIEAIFFCWNLQLPVALLSGINVNYMLWPPPGTGESFLGGTWYQFKFCCFFLSLHVAAGWGFPALTRGIKAIFFALWPSSTSRKGQQQKKKN